MAAITSDQATMLFVVKNVRPKFDQAEHVQQITFTGEDGMTLAIVGTPAWFTVPSPINSGAAVDITLDAGIFTQSFPEGQSVVSLQATKAGWTMCQVTITVKVENIYPGPPGPK